MNKLLADLIAMLKALHSLHHSAHWQARFYQDHLLFERLYGGIVQEYDSLAEKLVALSNEESVHAVALQEKSLIWMKRWAQKPEPVSRALQAELDLQTALRKVVGVVGGDSTLLGLDNLLRTIADAHDTAVYLLEQNAQREK